jgi:hypothetical protein
MDIRMWRHVHYQKEHREGSIIYFECTSHPNEDRVDEIESEHEFISSDDIHLVS